MSQTSIMTGGNSGLDWQCASNLSADRDNVVVFASRDVGAAQAAGAKLRQAGALIEVLPLDLAKRDSRRPIHRSSALSGTTLFRRSRCSSQS